MRAIAVLTCSLTVLVAPSSVYAGACWSPPVVAEVADPFRAPACPWCPGNRGIEYATQAGDAVRAVAAGEVTFAGWVAGTAYVTVRQAGGVLATYGNLDEPSLRRGDRVVASMLVGEAAGRVHFGLRVDGQYVDPAPMLGVAVGVPRLIPVDGSPAPPAPAPRLRCPV